MNSLTGRASSIVKEVGPGGTLDQMLELLQVRFGNRARRAKFLHELQTRKRKPQETLQELFLALCELRANAFGDDPSEQYPEAYFRNIFVDALNDKALRRSILVQKPGTMEAAYNITVELEAIGAYPTPVADPSRVKPKFRQLDREMVDSPKFLKETEMQKQVVGNQRLTELEELVRAQNAVINEMRQINLGDMEVPRRFYVQWRIQDLKNPVIRHMEVELSTIIGIRVFRQELLKMIKV